MTSAQPVVQFDAVGVGKAVGAYSNTPESWTHVISNAPNTAVIVGYSTEALFASWATLAPTAVTFGGQSMLPVSIELGGNNSDSSGHVALYILLNPTNRGSQTVGVTGPATAYDAWMNSVSYTGVGSLGTPTAVGGSSTALSTGAITSAVGHMAVAILGTFNTTVASPTGGTSRYSQSSGSNCNSGFLMDASGAASVTMGCTGGTSTAWSAAYVDLVAAKAS